jgi:hypothetical protein
MLFINILHFYLYLPFDIFAMQENWSLGIRTTGEQIVVKKMAHPGRGGRGGVRDALQM